MEAHDRTFASITRLGRWIAFGIVTSIVATAGCVRAEQSIGPTKNLESLIQAFIQTPPDSLETVERVLGTKLALISARQGNSYTVENIDLADIAIKRVDYDVSQQNVSRLLVLTLGGQCLSGTEFMQRHRSWDLVPGRGSSDGGPLYEWDEHLPWGILAFQFSVSTGCLSYVSINVSKKV